MSPPRRIPGSRAGTGPRAPRREGERTTLRVPADLAESVERYAAEHKTSVNDALVRLAYDGAAAYDREREIAELARVRAEAIMRQAPVDPDAEPLSGDEFTAAALAWRLGLLDDDDEDEDEMDA